MRHSRGDDIRHFNGLGILPGPVLGKLKERPPIASAHLAQG